MLAQKFAPNMIRFFGLLLLLLVGIVPSPASAQVAIGVVVRVAPPLIPVYEQPLCPGEGYIWVPGYWDWDADGDDYFWVPGTWVIAPQPGFFWTPGYWAWRDGGYFFTAGYWGPVVGFYGGIDYGFGYFGRGYVGGHWEGDRFFYNRAVNNINVNIIHNTYESRVENINVTRVSYNGGNGGINARPTPQEEAVMHERRMGPVAAQTEHLQAARSNAELHNSRNHGVPPVAATQRPGEFHNGRASAVSGDGAPSGPHERPATGALPSNSAIHPRELPPSQRMSAPNTGNSKYEQKYQKQQDKLYAQQEKDRQKLQQQQEKEHQRLDKQQADRARRQQTEQKHQQQTQQMVERHAQQRQQLQQQQRPPQQHPPSHPSHP